MGSTKVSTPTPPAAPTTTDTVKSYVENLPAMYAAELEWSPKIAEQQLQMISQYLPQYTALQQEMQMQYAPQLAEQQWQMQQQYAPLYAQQQQELQKQYEPGAYAATQNLGNMMTPEYLSGAGAFNQPSSPLLQQLGGIYSNDYLTGYSAQNAPGMDAARQRVIDQSRDAWASRGLVNSGMSAEDEARMVSEFEFPYALQQEQLTQQTLAQRQAAAMGLGQTELANQQNAWNNYYNQIAQRQNTALQLAGRYATPTQTSVTTPTVQASSYTPTSVMSGYNYGNVANNMQQGYGNYSGAYTNMYNTNAQMANSNPWLTATSGVLGMLGGGWAGNGFKIG